METPFLDLTKDDSDEERENSTGSSPEKDFESDLSNSTGAAEDPNFHEKAVTLLEVVGIYGVSLETCEKEIQLHRGDVNKAYEHLFEELDSYQIQDEDKSRVYPGRISAPYNGAGASSEHPGPSKVVVKRRRSPWANSSLRGEDEAATEPDSRKCQRCWNFAMPCDLKSPCIECVRAKVECVLNGLTQKKICLDEGKNVLGSQKSGAGGDPGDSGDSADEKVKSKNFGDELPQPEMEDSGDEEAESMLDHADKWINDQFPHPPEFRILMTFRHQRGRMTVPCEVLQENFSDLRAEIASHEDRQQRLTIVRAKVDVDAYELLVQFALCKDLVFDPAWELDVKIVTALDTVHAAIRLGFVHVNIIGGVLASKLRRMLSRDHLALENAHIERAYELGEENTYLRDIQRLFIDVAIRRQIEYQENPSKAPSFGGHSNHDNQHMNAAQEAAYLESDFVFAREKRRNPAFREAIMDGVCECLARRFTTTKGTKTFVYVTDPLTGGPLELSG